MLLQSIFYESEESFYFLQLLGADEVFGADVRQTPGSVFIYSTPVNTPCRDKWRGDRFTWSV